MTKTAITRRHFLAGAAGAAILPCGTVSAADAAATFPDWKEGALDIHHIATGRGEATLMVFPDGTTMLVDAGDMTGERPESTILPVTPDASRTPAEWITAYIARTLKPLNLTSPAIDYALMSHFHSDHIGCKRDGARTAHGYTLSGITAVAEEIDIKKLVDRGFPDYDFPSRKATEGSNRRFFNDYLAFTEHQREGRKARVEGFDTGSKTQFTPVRAAGRFPGFTVENIAANGRVAGGHVVVPRERTPDENTCSCAVKVTYGPFAYYTGGDLSGYSAARDMETPVAAAVGRVDAMKMNHHGYKDAVNPALLAALRPRVMTVLAWDEWHPHAETFARMTDPAIYPGERLIYATGLHDKCVERLGAAGAASIRPCGHVVVRVADGGASYRVCVLDPATFAVRHDSGTIKAGA
jgi:beta-lactamase superfamily II metal-dependent hydrolase